MAKIPPFGSQEDVDRLGGQIADLSPQIDRDEILIRELQGRVKALEQGSAGKGILATQSLVSTAAAYAANITSTAKANMTADAGGTQALQILYTPSLDCWWDTTLHVGLIEKMDAAYHYAYVSADLVPADEDGLSVCEGLASQRSDVIQYSHRNLSRRWKLKAGVAYVCIARFGPTSGGTWRYYKNAPDLFIQGAAYAR